MKKVSLSLSYKKIFSRLFDIIILIILFIIVLFIIHFNSDFSLEISLLVCFMVLPSVILFIEYLTVTLKIKSVIFYENHIEIMYKNGISTHIDYGEIELIKLYKAAGNDKGSFTINANENYYFARLIIKDNTTFVFTSLLGPDLSEGLELIKDVPVHRKKTGYAFISFLK